MASKRGIKSQAKIVEVVMVMVVFKPGMLTMTKHLSFLICRDEQKFSFQAIDWTVGDWRIFLKCPKMGTHKLIKFRQICEHAHKSPGYSGYSISWDPPLPELVFMSGDK